MALRCASGGACEVAGVATMNMAVTSSTPCFNVLIILGNPYRCRAGGGCNGIEVLNDGGSIVEDLIIFAFGFRCKRIVAIHESPKFSFGKNFQIKAGSGHG
jgi:hypothetical protein